jgi:hypothetical protein
LSKYVAEHYLEKQNDAEKDQKDAAGDENRLLDEMTDRSENPL